MVHKALGSCGFLKSLILQSWDHSPQARSSALAPQSISVQLLQHGGHVNQAELAAKVADDGGIVQHQDLAGGLALTVLTQVDCL